MKEVDLMGLHKKISRIEESDPNFSKNKKWVRLRKEQDLAFLEVARQRLRDFQIRNQSFFTEKNKKSIEFYERFIEDMERRIEENDIKI